MKNSRPCTSVLINRSSSSTPIEEVKYSFPDGSTMLFNHMGSIPPTKADQKDRHEMARTAGGGGDADDLESPLWHFFRLIYEAGCPTQPLIFEIDTDKRKESFEGFGRLK